MLRDAAFIARKEVKYWMYEREVWVWVFFMPVVFFYFIGTVTSGLGGGSGGGRDKLAVRVPGEADFLVARLQRRLAENNFEVIPVAGDDAWQQYSRRLTFPAGLADKVLAGEPATLVLAVDRSGLGREYDRLRVARAVYTTLADVVASRAGGQQLTPAALERLDQTPRALTLRVEPAGERPRVPTGFEQTIPGVLVMFVLMNVLTSGAITLVLDRKRGLLRRLASTPISRRDIFLGKWLARMGLAVIQIAMGLVVGTLLFGMDWGPDLPMVIVVLLAWGSFCASVGIVLGCAGVSEAQVIGLAILCSLLLAALGGCWWPIEITPDWMQAVQKMLPTGWAMDALHRLISFRHGAASALPHTLGMLAAALAVGWVGTRVFRFD